MGLQMDSPYGWLTLNCVLNLAQHYGSFKVVMHFELVLQGEAAHWHSGLE